jgi:hypothetical protein
MSNEAPTITEVVYDGTQCKVWWTPPTIPGVTGYRILASSSDSGILYQTDITGRQSKFGILPLDGPLPTNVVYTVQVQTITLGGTGESSPQLPLITSLPVLERAYYDGSSMWFDWVPVTGAARGYLIKVFSLDSGLTFTVTLSDPLAARGEIPASVLPAGGLNPSQQWVASLSALTSNNVSAETPGANLPKPLPTFSLKSSLYEGGIDLLASWNPLAGASSYRMVVKSSQADQYSIEIPSGGAGSGSLYFPSPLFPLQNYKFRVIAETNTKAGVSTPAASIVSALPALRSVVYDGQAVRLSWEISADVGVGTYMLKVTSLSTGNTQTATVSGRDTGSGSVPTGALDPAKKYIATVVAEAVSSVGGSSPAFPILAIQPEITSVSYGGDQVTVNWKPVTAPGVAGYIVTLLQGTATQQEVAVENPLQSSADFLLSTPLVDANTYSVRVTAFTLAGASAQSASKQLQVLRPQITYVTYYLKSLKAGWLQTLGASGYTVRVYSPSTGASYSKTVTPGVANRAVLDLPGLLGTEGDYLFSLTAFNANGASSISGPYPIPTALPVLQSLVYDGTKAYLEWQTAGSTAATVIGYRASIVSQSSGVTYSTTVNDPFASSAVIDNLPAQGLDPSQIYTGVVDVLSENDLAGETPTVTLVSSVPQLNYAFYYGTKIVAGWKRLTGNNQAVTGYDLSVTSTQDDTNYTVFIPNSLATFGTLAIPVPLSPNQFYLFTLSAVAPGGVRATNAVSPIITSRPELLSADYDGHLISLAWTVSANPAVTGYTLKLLSLSSGMTYTQLIPSPQASSGAIPAPAGGLDANQVWTVDVAANGPVPGVSESLTLVVQQPAILSAMHDGLSVQAQWSPIIGKGISAYRLTVTLPDQTQITATVVGERISQASIRLSNPFTLSGTYSVSVLAQAGAVSVSSAVRTLDTAQPKINSVTYTGGTVTATWDAVSNVNVTGYVMRMYSPTTSKSYSQQVAGRTTNTGTMTLNGLLGADEGYVFTLCTIESTGISVGSTPASVITALPQLASVTYDGNILSAAWIAQPDNYATLKGFQLTLRLASSSTPSQSQPINDPLARTGSLTAGTLSGIYVAEVRAVAESGVVTVSAAVAVITLKPSLSGISYTEGVIAAGWNAIAGLSAYKMGLFDSSNSLVASGIVAGNSAFLNVVPNPNQSYTVRLQGVSGISGGPLSDPLILISAAPVINSTQVAGAQAVVTWTPPPVQTGITGFAAQLLDGGIPLSVSPTYDGNKATFSVTLSASRSYSAIVQPTGVNTTGPYSEACPVVAAIPTILSAVLDGSRLLAAWGPIQQSEISGYHAELYQGSNKIAEFETKYPVLDQVLNLTAGLAYTIRVQARAGIAVGSFSPNVLVKSFGYQYYIQPAQPTVQPFIYRTLQSVASSSPAEAISLYLPEIFNRTQTEKIPSGAFSLDPTGATPYAYVMNFAKNSAAWQFDNNSIRIGLQGEYNQFLQALESVQGGMTQFGLALVRQVLALGLPLTYNETLFYRHGFDPANGYCDLEPGMGVRLDSEVFQFVGTSPTATQLSGFVVVGSRSYDVGDYISAGGSRETGFEAFLSAMSRPNVPANTRGSGGIIDLYAGGFRRHYYRVFYPANFTGGDSQGTLGLTNNVAILGCDTWKALSNATKIYLTTGSFSSVTDDISYTFFRGRMVVSPLIYVLVNGTPQQLALGTTVRELAQRCVELPMAQNTQVTSLQLERLAGNLVNSSQATLALDVSVKNPVRLTANPYQSIFEHPDAFDLPLISGDRLVIE